MKKKPPSYSRVPLIAWLVEILEYELKSFFDGYPSMPSDSRLHEYYFLFSDLLGALERILQVIDDIDEDMPTSPIRRPRREELPSPYVLEREIGHTLNEVREAQSQMHDMLEESLNMTRSIQRNTQEAFKIHHDLSACDTGTIHPVEAYIVKDSQGNQKIEFRCMDGTTTPEKGEIKGWDLVDLRR